MSYDGARRFGEGWRSNYNTNQPRQQQPPSWLTTTPWAATPYDGGLLQHPPLPAMPMPVLTNGGSSNSWGAPPRWDSTQQQQPQRDLGQQRHQQYQQQQQQTRERERERDTASGGRDDWGRDGNNNYGSSRGWRGGPCSGGGACGGSSYNPYTQRGYQHHYQHQPQTRNQQYHTRSHNHQPPQDHQCQYQYHQQPSWGDEDDSPSHPAVSATSSCGSDAPRDSPAVPNDDPLRPSDIATEVVPPGHEQAEHSERVESASKPAVNVTEQPAVVPTGDVGGTEGGDNTEMSSKLTSETSGHGSEIVMTEMPLFTQIPDPVYNTSEDLHREYGVGFRMMSMMGWKYGECLGRSGDGILKPLGVDQEIRPERAGLKDETESFPETKPWKGDPDQEPEWAPVTDNWCSDPVDTGNNSPVLNNTSSPSLSPPPTLQPINAPSSDSPFQPHSDIVSAVHNGYMCFGLAFSYSIRGGRFASVPSEISVHAFIPGETNATLPVFQKYLDPRPFIKGHCKTPAFPVDAERNFPRLLDELLLFLNTHKKYGTLPVIVTRRCDEERACLHAIAELAGRPDPISSRIFALEDLVFCIAKKQNIPFKSYPELQNQVHISYACESQIETKCDFHKKASHCAKAESRAIHSSISFVLRKLSEDVVKAKEGDQLSQQIAAYLEAQKTRKSS
ncbi:hypothetical protein Pelo_3290 [Pelomyxa schiedti]|nr:hypothetical protein Pelo_3290 [Pelomyxa schiedti]